MFRNFILFICLFFVSLQAEGTRILSLDGGGVRGVVSLELLRLLQNESSINIHEDFDIYAGTSTGSIIAVALASRLSVKELLHEYNALSSYVFGKKSHFSLFRPEYENKRLRTALKKILGFCGITEETLIKDLSKKIVLTTVNLDSQSPPHRWHMDVIENITPHGGNIKVIDAILESTAAPTYFPSLHGHIDGGMAMNDPSLCALMFAYQPHDDLRDFTILSLGTGYYPHFIKNDESWGTLKWGMLGSHESGRLPILNLIMDVEEQIPEQILTKFLGGQYKKIDIPFSKEMILDDYKEVPELIQCTQKYRTSHPNKWKEDCNWVRQQFHADKWWYRIMSPFYR